MMKKRDFFLTNCAVAVLACFATIQPQASWAGAACENDGLARKAARLCEYLSLDDCSRNTDVCEVISPATGDCVNRYGHMGSACKEIGRRYERYGNARIKSECAKMPRICQYVEADEPSETRCQPNSAIFGN